MICLSKGHRHPLGASLMTSHGSLIITTINNELKTI